MHSSFFQQLIFVLLQCALPVILGQSATVYNTTITPGGSLILSSNPNARGNNVQQRSGIQASAGQKTWLDFKNPLPRGTLTKFYLYISNVSLTETYHIHLQIWQPVDMATLSFQLVWDSRQTIIGSSVTSRGALFEWDVTQSPAFIVPSGSYIAWTCEEQTCPVSFDYDSTALSITYFYFTGNPGTSRFPVVGNITRFDDIYLPSLNSDAVEIIPYAPPGATGATGATGLPGGTGATGAVGATGLFGSIGATGATGAPGWPGSQGATGSVGATGATGFIGATGQVGPIGQPGSNGLPGLVGPMGPSGQVGATGLVGSPGRTGSSGLPGSPGIPGRGTTGATGFTGVQGLPGSPGLPGPIGSVGLPGPPGVVLLPSGVYVVGSPGEPGSPGSTGSTGLLGSPGSQGLPGSPGQLGSTGSTGPMGPQGIQGLPGWCTNSTYDDEITSTVSWVAVAVAGTSLVCNIVSFVIFCFQCKRIKSSDSTSLAANAATGAATEFQPARKFNVTAADNPYEKKTMSDQTSHHYEELPNAATSGF